ncbi:MAG: c-type cytochrome [Planctomycetaceae bacterium]|nr:c-type cytochrome [Planctomycetaceae bacterium]
MKFAFLASLFTILTTSLVLFTEAPAQTPESQNLSVTADAPASTEKKKPVSPLDPKQALKDFQIHPDVKIELVASEPQVVDPVAVAFDEYQRLWVVEMTDYPHGPAEGEPPKSQIKILRDKDGDGYYETATVFADHLLFANGVLPWKGGVITTMSGEIAYLKDTDGDDKMDVKETWFRGFAEQNPQLRANHPTLGLDGWIYVSNGLRGGKVVAVKKEWAEDAEPLDLSRVDFRFHPETGEYEGITGTGQFGLIFDDYGNRFTCSNRNPCMHIVLEQRDLAQNPYALLPSLRHDVSPAGQDSRVYSITTAWTTSTQHAGQFTAACGVTNYRGDGLGPKFYGNSFTCEPTGSLLHRDVLSPQGGSFTSHYGRDEVEFLASEDSWFRPVNMAHGPDGALYLCDMYRAVIEHPQFMPDELKVRKDLTDGNDRGRVYRLSARQPIQERSQHRPSHLAELTSEDLVYLLSHSNGWHRDTAFRLLTERRDLEVTVQLRKMLTECEHTPAAVSALWLLSNWGQLTDEDLKTVLHTANQKLITQLLKAEEKRLIEETAYHSLLEETAKLEDGHLQLQLAISTGKMQASPLKTRVLTKLSLKTGGDPWLVASVRIAANDRPVDLLSAVLIQTSDENFGALKPVISSLSQLIGARRAVQKNAEIIATLNTLSELHPVDKKKPLALPLSQTIMLGLGSTIGPLSQSESLTPAARDQLQTVFAQSAQAAANPEEELATRLNSLQLLRYAPRETSLKVLEQLALHETNSALRQQAIGIWSALDPKAAAPALLADYSRQTPAIRSEILGSIVGSSAMVPFLLDAVEAGKVPAGEIQAHHRRILARHKDADLKKRINTVLASTAAEDRKPVLAKYQAALKMTSDPKRGRAIFEKNCTACHRIGKLGVNVAPDIADSRTAKPEALLTNILDPNRAIDNNYFSYTIVLDDGKVLTGIIANETGNSVTLKQPENKTVTILKDNIEEMKSDGVSLMPNGLEKNITIQDMADLISFIKNWRYLDGNVPIDLGQTSVER